MCPAFREGKKEELSESQHREKQVWVSCLCSETQALITKQDPWHVPRAAVFPASSKSLCGAGCSWLGVLFPVVLLCRARFLQELET